MSFNKFVRSNKFIVDENDECTTVKIMEKIYMVENRIQIQVYERNQFTYYKC